MSRQMDDINFGFRKKDARPDEYSMNNEDLNKMWHKLTGIQNEIASIRDDIEGAFHYIVKLKDKEWIFRCPHCGQAVVLSVDKNKISVILSSLDHELNEDDRNQYEGE